MKHFYSVKKLFSLLVLLFIAGSTVWAAPRDLEQAKQAAREQMGRHAAQRVKGLSHEETIVDPQLVFSKLRAKPDEVYYYVFSAGDDRGYTIVSGDDRLPAIVGYTESGAYEIDKLPANFVSFMQAYENFIDSATDQQIEEVTAWKAQRTAHAPVSPFLTSKWNQTEPYNNQCPDYYYYGSGNKLQKDKSVTGCVATAIAQILHYYQCPDQLKATIPAYGIKLSVNGYPNDIQMPEVKAGEGYDWANMLPDYTTGATAVQKEAVAKLMLHVGCAVKMSYGPSSSASATAETLTKYFGMDPELTRQLNRRDYQISVWDGMLYEELTAGRPVYYDGQSTGGGHAFVIHGYSDGLYYVNWGWGGLADGYFDITLLNPHNTSGAGASSSADGYSMENSMIIGIQPDNGVKDEIVNPTILSYKDLVVSVSGIKNSEVSGTVTATPLNQSMTEVTFVSVGYKNEEGHIVNVVPSPYRINGSVDLKPDYYRSISLSYSFQYAEGKAYKLMFIESRDGSNWIPCHDAEATSVILKIQDGQVSLYKERSELSATVALDAYSGGYAKMSNTIAVSVRNAGEKEYYDKVYVLVNNSSAKPNVYTFALGITAPANGEASFDFEYTPNAKGTYYFWVLDVNQNEIGTGSIDFEETEAPALSFVSITCDNVSENKIRAPYSGYDEVEMNVVCGNQATFTFEIRNDGGYYEGLFKVYNYAGTSSWSLFETVKLTLPAHETVRSTFTIKGSTGEVVGLRMAGDATIKGLAQANSHAVYNPIGALLGYFNLTESEICYLADVEDAITQTKADTGNDGVYYNLQGMQVTQPKKGIYIKNGKKYIVR